MAELPPGVNDMNKTIPRILIITGLALLAAGAQGLDYEQWKAYCNKSEQNQQRCTTATRLCEQNDKADCDQIRTAFMQEKPIPESVLPSNTD
jgi:hypothetical protein